ncbi:hypothetical protein BDZ89DRAFT_769840 [Hymenopellis radicata]|nr:hypothetical protein BDZ89DRAFT_769840 [Hymenopellis radicata]
MPRIRKKTSNRGTTNNRKKIQQKVRETRKKKTKAAKVNPQWKSKHKKDPGIPNDFPYKDQILAEVQEERRLAIEEKQRRKEAKKALKTGEPAQEMDIDENTEIKDFDGVASIAAKALRNVKLTRMERKVTEVSVVEDEDEDLEPALFNRDLPNLKAVLDHADVVLEVLDCRDPPSFRSSKVEEIASSKPIIFVLNKIDLCPQEAVSAWVKHLRGEHPTVLFRSASAFVPAEVECSKLEKGKGKVPLDNAVGVESLLKLLGEASQRKDGDGPLAVAVVGFTNVGKSSVINSVAKRPALPTYTLDSNSKGPTTTVLPQEVTVDGFKFIDTPGLTWEREDLTEENRARDILLRNKGRIDRLKEPMAPVTQIVARANNEDLMVHYSLPAFSQGDVDAFLPGLARSKQLVKRRSAVDLVAACRVILRDWNTSALRWYAMPSSHAGEVDDAADKSIIDVLPTRRELRKSGGLVRFATGEIDGRRPAFEEPYTVESDDESEGGEGGEDEDDVEGVDGDDDVPEADEEEEGQDDEEEDDLAPPPPLSGKQKRKRGKETSLPANKKVAFSAKQSTAHKPQLAEKPARKVANAPSKSKSKPKAASPSGSGEAGEAYDFGKFF